LTIYNIRKRHFLLKYIGSPGLSLSMLKNTDGFARALNFTARSQALTSGQRPLLLLQNLLIASIPVLV
jgi:hypothetical protein